MENSKLYRLNAAELLDTTIHTLKKTFKKQLTVSAISLGIYAVLILFFAILIGLSTFAAMVNSTNIDAVDIPTMLFGVFILVIAMMGVYCFSSLANMALTKQYLYGETLSVKKAFKSAFSCLPHALSTYIAIFIYYIPVVIVMSIILALVGVAISVFAVGGEPSAFVIIFYIVLIVIGYMGMILFILAASTMVSLTLPVALFEKKAFFGALDKSIKLTKHEFSKVFGTYLLFMLMYVGITYSFTFIFDIIGGVFTGISAASGQDASVGFSITQILSFIVSTLVSLFTAPIYGIFYTHFYYNQRVKLNGFDIEYGFMQLTKQLETDRAQQAQQTNENTQKATQGEF